MTVTYKKQNLNIKNKDGINYLFDASIYENHKLYFACKSKKEFKIAHSNKINLMLDIYSSLSDIVKNYDIIVCPESSSNFIYKIVSTVAYLGNKDYKILYKNDKDYISKSVLNNNFMSKDEIISHNNRIGKMSYEFFKINEIKTNKRNMYEKYLFRDIDIDTSKKILFIDDFMCSGSTINAVKHHIENFDILCIFKK